MTTNVDFNDNYVLLWNCSWNLGGDATLQGFGHGSILIFYQLSNVFITLNRTLNLK